MQLTPVVIALQKKPISTIIFHPFRELAEQEDKFIQFRNVQRRMKFKMPLECTKANKLLNEDTPSKIMNYKQRI